MAVRITVRFEPDLGKLARKFRVGRQGHYDRALSQAAEATAKFVRAEAPKRSGKLARSWRVRKRGRLRYSVETTGVFYEPFQREGVPPGKINPILPRRKKALWWPGLAHPVARVDNHPGIKRNDYVARGTAQAQTLVDKAFADMGEDILVEVA